MTFPARDLSQRWVQLLSLLAALDLSSANIVWLFDDGPTPLALAEQLSEAGYSCQRQPGATTITWLCEQTQLIHIVDSRRQTNPLPAPTRALWLTPPRFDLKQFWSVWQRRVRKRPVAAARRHWDRLNLARDVAAAPDAPELLLRLGEAALAVGDMGAAAWSLTQLRAKADGSSNWEVAIVLSAPLALLAGEGDRARELWRHAFTRADLSEELKAAAAAGLGWLHAEQEALVQAQNDWQLAAHLAPDWAQPQLALADIFLRQGRPDKAQAALRIASSREPGARAVHSAYGRLMHRLRDYANASKALSQAVLQPAHPAELGRDYLILGRSLVAQGETPAGQFALAQAAALLPGSSAPHNDLGNVLARQGAYEQAIAHYERAILCDDLSLVNLAKIHNGLANACYQVGRHEMAIRNYEQAIALDYRYARAYNGLGMVLRATGRFAAARDAFHKAIDLDQGYAAPYYGLGSIHSLHGELAEAVNAYKAAIAREPDSALPHCSLAAIYRRQDRPDEAAQQLAEAAQYIEREKAYNLACYTAIKGDSEAALKWLAQAVEETPGITAWMKQDPDFATLHDLPRFQALLSMNPPTLEN